MNDTYTPARLYAGLIGAVLVIVGILGFFYSSSFGDPGEVDAVLGVLDINAWHNLVHIASGALGILAFRSGLAASRTYALAFGAIYIVVAIWGFAIGSGESILGFIPVNTEDSVLHTLLGVLGIAAYAASDPGPKREPSTTSRTAG